MNNYQLYLYAFAKTLAGEAISTRQPDIVNSWDTDMWAAVALGTYCAKNNLLLTQSQFNTVLPKMSQ